MFYSKTSIKIIQSSHKQPWLVPSNEVRLRQTQLSRVLGTVTKPARPEGKLV
jgi:hypothetical protein